MQNSANRRSVNISTPAPHEQPAATQTAENWAVAGNAIAISINRMRLQGWGA